MTGPGTRGIYILIPYQSSLTSNLNPIHGEVYSIQHYVIKYVGD